MKVCGGVLIVAASLIAVVFYYLPEMRRIPAAEEVLVAFGQSQERVLPNPFRVLVWNAYKGQRSGWNRDLLRIVSGADLILLQEARLPWPHGNVLERIEVFSWQYAKSFDYRMGGGSTGVITGSRASVGAVSYQRSVGREPLVQTPKMSLFCRYELENSDFELLVVNVHSLLACSDSAYEAQLKNMARVIQVHLGPVVLAGDFNCWSAARLGILTQVAEELRLHPVRFAPDLRTTVFGRPIDYAYVRGLAVISSGIHGELKTSDHRAMEFVLKLES